MQRVCYWHALRVTWTAETFSVDLDHVEKDQRYKQLQYGRVPSILSKYHL